ncbi:MAG TPA: hypothetical protein EYQ24_17440 [Bacteroidetes bacterium]|nr:hypothetical protein [Bacteroidota bacterium]HIL58939.1 hypothetical protein [Rhodothermales bacterium]
MRRSFLLASALVLALVGATALSPDTSEAAAVVTADSGSDAVAELGLGCTVTIRARNSGSRDIEIDLTDSKVKVRNGLWKRIDKAGGAVRGACSDDEVSVDHDGETYGETCNLDLGCNTRRRYKFEIKRGGNTHIQYYPSANGWTRRTTIDLGDVSRHF